jgi:MATE family multidrug resistance protein
MAYWYRRVFLLAIPLILSNLTQPLLSTVDTILSGHLPGPSALGGVALPSIEKGFATPAPCTIQPVG